LIFVLQAFGIKESPARAVPQSNWKQCVWKNLNGDKDNGKIKVKGKERR